jgi:diguanylate cyclase (GGDEF)-like protein
LRERLDAVIADCAKANGGKNLPIRIGVYPDRIEAVEIGTACDRARLAADIWKKRKESYYSFFDMEMMAEEKNRQEIIDNLDKAIEEGWIQVYYQPIIRSTNGKICNFEALARWNDPVRGILTPASFIPVLEEAMLIPKLDLCVVRQVLRDMKDGLQAGNRILPVSINFSRADFEAYDLVHEICTLVDAAQVDRKLIIIEITESMVGSDFEYMKQQIERFRAQGFQVWMDDFGSGYSSLDVLQSVKFDLIKFDMGFMRRLNEGENGKIILREMMKMAISLGVDTICEGVETVEQVRFLQEIGCSKLQGYYFMKPAPADQILEKYKVNRQDGFEDPLQSGYYDTMGRVNLYDLSFLANIDDSVAKNTFDTVPMGIMEVNSEGDKVKYVRSNQSFRDFMKRAFHLDLSDPDQEYPIQKDDHGSDIRKAIAQCHTNENRAFIDEELEDGSILHSFMRRIVKNPVNGKESFALAVLSVTEPDESKKYAEIAKRLQQETVSLGRIAALSPDYIVLYIIDPDTGHYTQYNASKAYEDVGLAKLGEDFFADVISDSPRAIAPEDLERHLRVLTKENMLSEIHKDGSLIHNYRMLMDGKRVPVSLRATLIRENDKEKIILGITNDEEEYRRKLERAYKQASSTAAIYTHIAHALARGSTDLFYVNLDTGDFIEYHTDDERGVLNEARRGTAFFERCKQEAKLYVHRDDQAALLKVLDIRLLTGRLERNKVVEFTYRRIEEGRSFYVLMKISRMEDDKRFIVISVSDIDELMRKRRAEERVQDERTIYARLHAITGNNIVVYVVDPENGDYHEFSATNDYEESLKQAKDGTDFFAKVREEASIYNHPNDLEFFLSLFTKENILAEIERSGIFTLKYRLMFEDRPLHVQLKAAMVEEKEGKRLIVGLTDIDAQVRQEKELGRLLAQAQTEANIDALTGIKNKHAYLTAEARLNQQIAEHTHAPFAIVMLDVNDLKKVNDTAGHQAGDQYLKDACKIVCNTFKRSPVFRVGGDEFAVIAKGDDYARIEELIEIMDDYNAEAARTGGIVIACGMARYDNDASVSPVLKRADNKMYENKSKLKRKL